jgi:hypothetical protein
MKMVQKGLSVVLLWTAVLFCMDARFAGMGNLSYLFEDDFNRLNLYDYADFSSCFFRCDTTSSIAVRGSGLHERWQEDSLSYVSIGQAIPAKLMDFAPVEAAVFYRDVPQFELIPNQLVYRSRRLRDERDHFGNVKKTQSYCLYAGYSQMDLTELRTDETESVKTPSGRIVFSKPLSKQLDLGISADAFYGYYRNHDASDKITLLPIGGGGGLSYHRENINVAMDVEYHYPMFKYQGEYGSESFNGHAVTPRIGSVIEIAQLTWISVIDYRWLSLKGKADGNEMGTLDLDGYGARTRLLFAPNFMRYAGFGEYRRRNPVYTDENEDIWFDTAYSVYSFGGGAGMVMGVVSAGCEAEYNYSLEDDIENETQRKGTDMRIRLGGEFETNARILIRAGFNYSKADPDLDFEANSITTSAVTGGFGTRIVQGMVVDLAYNYQWETSENDPDERVTDHIVYLYLSHILKQNKR